MTLIAISRFQCRDWWSHRLWRMTRLLCLMVLAVGWIGHTTLAEAGTCTNGGSPSKPDGQYTDNGNGTVTDTVTNLTWKRCSEGQTWDGSTCTGTATGHDWNAAVTLAAGTSFAGQNDWRMPTLTELQTLIETCRTNPTINDTIFPATPGTNTDLVSRVWSGSLAATPGYAWHVYFYTGYPLSSLPLSYPLGVRLVRGGQSLGALSFTAVNNALLSTTQTSNAVTVSGLPTSGTISITGGEYQIGSGAWSSTPGNVSNGDTVTVRHTSSASYSTAVTTTLDINGVKASFVSTTVPAPHTVTPSAGANGSISPNTPQTINHGSTTSFTVTPNVGHVIHSVTGCGGSLSGNTYTTAAVTGACSVTASFVGNDSTPDAFSFTAANNVALSTLQTSNTITVSGLTTAANISITGGDYKINSGSFVSTAGTVNNGDTVTLRHTSSASYSTAVTTTLSIGGVSGNFVSTTALVPTSSFESSQKTTSIIIESGSRVLSSGGTYQVAQGAADNSRPSVLIVRGSVTLQPHGNATSPNLHITSQGDAAAEFGFVLDAQGRVMPRLLSGSAIVRTTKDDVQPLLAWLSANTPTPVVLTGQSCGNSTPSSVLIQIDPATQHIQVSVLSCGIAVSAADSSSATRARNTITTTAATATPYFAGEILSVNSQGQIIAVHLGSLDARGLAGDALSPTPNTPHNLSRTTSTPVLNGTVARQQQDLPSLLRDTLAAHGYEHAIVSGSTGQVSAIVNAQRHSWLALGRIAVDTHSFGSSVQPNEQGGLRINARGVQLELVPSAIDLEGLARALQAWGAQLQVQPHGGYVLTLNGQTLALHIGSRLSPRPASSTLNELPLLQAHTQAPPAVLDILSQFFTQTLYTGVADWAAVQQLVQGDTGNTASIQADGTVRITLNGQAFTLWPQMRLLPMPADRNGHTHWLEGNQLFITLPQIPGFVQAFEVR